MDDIELRYNLLDRAREMLTKNWEQKVRVEEAVARFENRAPKHINPPTLFKVMSVAEKLYKFVHKEEAPVEESETDTETSEASEVEEPSEPEESETEASE